MCDQSITAYEDLPFTPISEDNPVEAALLWGDPTIGPAAMMLRFPEGHHEPWHSHSSSYHAVLIKGAFRSHSQADGGQPSDIYGPGAYVVQQGGKVHAEANTGDGAMVALVYFDGPVDFILAD